MPSALERLRASRPRDRLLVPLTAAVLVLTAALVIAFFPRGDAAHPRFELAWPGRAERVLGPLDPVPAWSLAPLALSGRGFQGTRVSVLIDGRRALDLPVRPDGVVQARFRIPAGLRRGPHELAVLDQGSGQVIGPPLRLVLVRGPAPDIWVGPQPARHVLLLVASGFTGGTRARIVVDPSGPEPVAIGSVAVRPNGRLALVLGLPPTLAGGLHVLRVLDDAGRHADAGLDVRG